MKHILSIVLLIAISSSSYAKKLYYPLEVVAGMADLIVVGEIKGVNQGSYQFKITKTVKGKETGLIKVQMFKEWTCDHRMKKAETGQKLFLFLNKKGGKYEIINGSTGEMFIEDDKVLRTINGDKPTVDELVNSIKYFVKAFKLKNKDYEPFDETVFIQLLPDSEIEKLAKESILTNWFFDKIKDYKIEK
jgi:hypothetical protein